MRQAHRRQSERGTVAVEFALLLPFLAVLFMTIVDFGRVLHEHQILVNAAREGARFSSFSKYKNDIANIKNHVIAYAGLENVPLTAADITVNQGVTITAGTITIPASQVTVSVTRTLLIPGAGFLTNSTITMGGTAIFRNFY